MKKTLRKITDLLESQFGEDFSQYKTTTLWRRVEKRMLLHKISDFAEYLDLLKSNKVELQELHDDFLIHVSHFFRDPEVFQFLAQEVIPKLIENHSDKNIRVWVPACSNGEEAYTLAILFLEAFKKLKLVPRLQVFATDISSKAIKKAREGAYQVNSIKNVPSDLLKKYFDQSGEYFLLKKSVKSKVLFAKQNIVQSPPFSKIDLLSCRNALIYFDKSLQQRAFDIFNYALKQEGLLLLGRSESINDEEHFSVLHSEYKLFQLKKRRESNFRLWNNAIKLDSKYLIDESDGKTKLLEKEARDIIFKTFIPFSAILNQKGEVVFFEGDAKKFFEFKTGVLSNKILDLVKEEFKPSLKKLLEVCLESDDNQTHTKAAFDKHGISKYKLSAKKLARKIEGESNFLISIIDRKTLVSKSEKELEVNHEESLASELKETREHLENTIGELEELNEKLREKAEEEQLMNEELQSSNEELESSQEELQSLNEELLASNNELQTKIQQLTQSNNILANLIGSTRIPSLFLNKSLQIRKFTPTIEQLIGLEESDIGRSLKNFHFKFKSPSFFQKCEAVINDGKAFKFELQANDGTYYWTQIMPYFNEVKEQDGLVINFYDISEQKDRALELEEHRGDLEDLLKKKSRELVEREADLRGITKNFPNGTIALIDKYFQVVYASGSNLKSAENTDGELIDKPLSKVFGTELSKKLKDSIKIALKGDRFLKEVIHNDRILLNSVQPVVNADGKIKRVVLTSIDITQQKRLSLERERFALALQKSINEIYLFDASNLKFEYVNQGALDNLGYTINEIKQLTPLDLKKEYDKKSFEKLLAPLRSKEKKHIYFETNHQRADGSKYPVDVSIQLIDDDAGDYFMAIINDSTDRLKAEKSIRDLENRMKTAVRITKLGYWEHNFIKNTIEWSEQMYHIYDLPKSFTPTAENLAKYTHPDDYEHADQTLNEWKENKKGEPFQYRIIRESGEVRYLSAQVEAISDNKGKVEKLQGTILDITTDKKKEIALSNIANNTEERFVHVDLDFRIVNFNQQFQQEYRQFYNKKVEIGDSILDYAVSKEKNELVNIYKKVFKGEIINKDLKVDLGSNSFLSYQIIYKPAKDELGNIIGAFVSIIDLTKIKETKEKLRLQGEQLKLMANNFPSGSISLLDKNLNIRVTGGEGYTSFHIDPQSFIDKHVKSVLPEAISSRLIKASKKVFDGERFEEEFKFDGKYWHNTYIPLIESDGIINYMVLTSIDVTEREKARKALEASEERLNLIVKGSQDAYWDYDIIEDNIFYSDSWFEMIGYEEDELDQRSELFFELMPPEDEPRVRKAIQKAWSDGSEVYEIEVRLRHKQGHFIHVLSRAYIERNPKGEAIRSAGTNFDLTEIREMEDKLKKAKNEAEKANSAKNIFLSNMTHEIKTPLNGIIGFSRLLEKETLSKTGRKYVTHINKSGKSLLDILNSILDLTRIEEGGKKLNIQAVNLNSLINSIRSALLFQAQEKNLSLNFKVDNNVPRYLEVDETKLKQVLFNLMGNSIKFTTEGEVSLQIKLLKKEKNSEHTLRFVVEDTGIGIAKDEQVEIFESFRQSNESISSHHGGAGIGLTISQKLVHIMGSELKLSSDLGEGSQFYFDLTVNSASTVPDIQQSEFRTCRPDIEASILIVDDEETNVILAESIIKNYFSNIKVFSSTDPNDGIEIFDKKEIDLILLDLKMPHLNGFEFTQIIRQKKDKTQPEIIAITAGNKEEDYKGCLTAGMNAYINKPIKESELISAIEKSLIRIKSAPHFNQQSLYKKLRNDQDKVKRMVDSIRPLLKKAPNHLKQFLANSDEKSFMDLLHTLKGSSRNIGFTKLAELSKKLEELDFKQDKKLSHGIDEIESEIKTLESIINSL